MLWKIPVSQFRPGVTRRFYRAESISLSREVLAAVNAQSMPQSKIREALNHNLYALASVIALRSPDRISLETQNEILRGLVRYHPRLTPVNLVALTKLSHKMDVQLHSTDKALLLQTLVLYGDQELFLSGLDILDALKGGPIPISAVMRSVQFAYTCGHLKSCESLWLYIKKHYLLQLPQYTALMSDLMRAFARAKEYEQLAREVAIYCISNAGNPGIALSIAKVSYKLRDRSLLNQLLRHPDFKPSRAVEGVIAQLDADVSRADDLSNQEFSGVIKNIARDDLQRAENAVEARHDDKMLAQMALANEYIESGDLQKFRAILSELSSLHAAPGVLLNFELKWQLRHGTFEKAKRHYQNWQHVHFRQRVIALNTLSALASKPDEFAWVKNERKYLASIRIK